MLRAKVQGRIAIRPCHKTNMNPFSINEGLRDRTLTMSSVELGFSQINKMGYCFTALNDISLWWLR